MSNLPPFNLEQLNLKIDGGKPGLMSGSPARYRAKVPGGWLIVFWWTHAATIFYPDPDHEWDGGTLEARPNEHDADHR